MITSILQNFSISAFISPNSTSNNEGSQEPREKTLIDWHEKNRSQVHQSHDPVIEQLLRSSRTRQPQAFYYFGGSSPRQLRLATIESIFTIEDSPHRYLTAYCHLRGEHRTFRTDRISLA